MVQVYRMAFLGKGLKVPSSDTNQGASGSLPFAAPTSCHEEKGRNCHTYSSVMEKEGVGRRSKMKKPKANQKRGKGTASVPSPARKKPGRKPAEPFQLTPEQLREIEKAKCKTHDFRLRSRLLALIWSSQGKSEQEI